MVSFAYYAQSACLWRSMAKVLAMVYLFDADLIAARRSIGGHRSNSSSTALCGPNSFDSGGQCTCNSGFECVVGGWLNRCLLRGGFLLATRRSNNEYMPELCLERYRAPCECRAVFTRARAREARGEASGRAPSALDAIRPIEVDEDFVKAQLSSLPSSLRDEIMSTITCPISLHVMRDPVVAEDGNTYDRASILGAFRAKAAGEPIRGIGGDIRSRTVYENLNVRRLLAEFERLEHVAKERKDDAK
eukprot:TRINITY_DN4533_c0_g4_i1.p1 TRINITY_DN4533_c0_g4~~TRINITY_DN4533_c0_g4_i1.p1  ORF type:complete len:247 (-),score=29.31 TRINITY_DN4533_c0_g4_i1:58-798(-)